MAPDHPYQQFSPPTAGVALPVLIDLPHSGIIYPDDFKFGVDLEDLRTLESKHLDLLFSVAPRLGATVLAARIARSYVDCNRDASQIDPEMFSAAVLNAEIERSQISYEGVFPRKLLDGRAIYSRPMGFLEGRERLDRVYFPYRQALERAIEKMMTIFPVVTHLSCYTCAETERVDIRLSNNDGIAADQEFLSHLIDLAHSLGLTSNVMHKKQTGTIICDVGDPLRGIHSVELHFHPRLFRNHRLINCAQELSNCRGLIAAIIDTAAQYADSSRKREDAF